MYMLALLSAVVSDLAAPAANDAIQLHAEPNIWLAHGFLSDSSVSHVLSRLPKDESAYTPCIGQVEEYSSKRCTFLPVVGDSVIETVVAKIQAAWKIDTSALTKSGLPVIRYLPGAPPVGVHGDIGANGLVPNATLVLYLTDSEQSSGQTYFPSIGPEGGVQVTPRRGSILSFQNVDGRGHPNPKVRHGVRAVSANASSDRFVVQIPIVHPLATSAGQGAGNALHMAYAYAEHVSGMKNHAAGNHGGGGGGGGGGESPIEKCLASCLVRAPTS